MSIEMFVVLAILMIVLFTAIALFRRPTRKRSGGSHARNVRSSSDSSGAGTSVLFGGSDCGSGGDGGGGCGGGGGD